MKSFAAALLGLTLMTMSAAADTAPTAAPGGGDRYAGPGFATRAGTEAAHALTSNPDHSLGTDHRQCSIIEVHRAGESRGLHFA